MPSRRRDDDRIQEQLIARLRAAGLRRTGARVAVLERLARADAPLSHGEVADALRPHDCDRATVYRNLMDLVEAGIVARTDMGDHVWRFSLVGEDGTVHGKQHPHLVCNDCGNVVCLPDVKVKIAAKRPMNDLEVQLRGLCESCAP